VLFRGVRRKLELKKEWRLYMNKYIQTKIIDGKKYYSLAMECAFSTLMHIEGEKSDEIDNILNQLKPCWYRIDAACVSNENTNPETEVSLEQTIVRELLLKSYLNMAAVILRSIYGDDFGDKYMEERKKIQAVFA